MGIFDRNNPNQNYPNRASGIGPRFIGAIILAIIAFIMYMSQSQENPVTGEKQHVSISPAQEIRLGLESAPAMSQKMGGELPSSDPRAQRVEKLGQLIVSQTAAAKSPWKFRFHLLADTKTVNAFALPGGQIFITLGLYDKLKTDDQLAGVLSHEMGHVIERHSAQQMAKGQLGQLLVSAVAVGASDPQQYGSGQTAAMVASVVNQMVQLRYSRTDESQADIWGLKLMKQSGYDPNALIQVMEILKASGGRGHTPEIFQSHPNPDLRIEQIKEYLKNTRTKNEPKSPIQPVPVTVPVHD
ncbi:MAG: M48 family metallopeptidase [Parachlamydiaceae bacterium]|nr:M48 family metallopeptidase [Parachlamydiaceae bacterium]